MGWSTGGITVRTYEGHGPIRQKGHDKLNFVDLAKDLEHFPGEKIRVDRLASYFPVPTLKEPG